MANPMVMRGMVLLFAAVILGLTGGFAWSRYTPSPAAAIANARKVPSAEPGQTAKEIEDSAYYADCDAVRAAGKAPIYPGQPGYRAELDRGGTGVACVPTN